MRFAALFLVLLVLALPAAAQLIAIPVGEETPAVAVVTIPPPAPVAAPGQRLMEPRDLAVLQVLDKVSARTTKLRVPVGSSAAFGLMFVTVRSCQVAPPSETPEAAAFVEISEVGLGRTDPVSGQPSSVKAQPERLLFSGWMFASSPALSALEHPTYDVTVMACETRTVSAAERAASGEEAAAGGTGSLGSEDMPSSSTGSAGAASSSSPADSDTPVD